MLDGEVTRGAGSSARARSGSRVAPAPATPSREAGGDQLAQPAGLEGLDVVVEEEDQVVAGALYAPARWSREKDAGSALTIVSSSNGHLGDVLEEV